MAGGTDWRRAWHPTRNQRRLDYQTLPAATHGANHTVQDTLAVFIFIHRDFLPGPERVDTKMSPPLSPAPFALVDPK